MRSISVVLLLTSLAWGQSSAPTPQLIELGSVPRGLKVTRNVTLRNPFDSTMQVGKIKTSCGCTAAMLSNEMIPVGQSGTLRTELDTDRYTGQVRQTITLEVLKPSSQSIQLTVQANIRTDMTLSQPALDWKTFLAGDQTEKKLQLTYTGPLDFRLTQVLAQDDAPVVVSAQETARQAGRVVYDIVARLKGPAATGPMYSTVQCVTNHPEVGTFTLPVLGTAKTGLLVEPESVFMGFVKPGAKAMKTVSLRAQNPFRLTQIVRDETAFTPQAKNQMAREHLLTINFDGPLKPGYYSDYLKIHTTLPEAGIINIRVFGWVDKK